MAYKEVSRVDVTEVVRRWQMGGVVFQELKASKRGDFQELKARFSGSSVHSGS